MSKTEEPSRSPFRGLYSNEEDRPKNHRDPNERTNYRLYTDSTIKKKKKRKENPQQTQNRLEEDGRRKGERLIVEYGKFARQWEQHVQRLRGENEPGRFTDKEDPGVEA